MISYENIKLRKENYFSWLTASVLPVHVALIVLHIPAFELSWTNSDYFLLVTSLRVWEMSYAFIQLYNLLKVFKLFGTIAFMFQRVVSDLRGFTLYFLLNVTFFALINSVIDAEIVNESDYSHLPKLI